MGIFFESPRVKQPIRDALALALMEPSPANIDAARQRADQRAAEVAGQGGGVGPPKTWSFVTAAVLLALAAGGALWAESAKWTEATKQLWTAFQTILGVVLGFIGGEATGAGGKGQSQS